MPMWYSVLTAALALATTSGMSPDRSVTSLVPKTRSARPQTYTVLVSAMDGNVYAYDERTGSALWTVDTGECFVSSFQAPAPSSGAMSGTQDPFVIPGGNGNGRIYVYGNEQMQEMPFTAHDLVSNSPFSWGATMLFLGSQSSRLFAVGSRTGHVYQSMRAAEPVCPSDCDVQSAPADDPVIWLGRRDLHVKAVDGITTRQRWNFTVGELVSPLKPMRGGSEDGTPPPGFDLELTVTLQGKIFATRLSSNDHAWQADVGGPISAIHVLHGNSLRPISFHHADPGLPRSLVSAPAMEGMPSIVVATTTSGQLFGLPLPASMEDIMDVDPEGLPPARVTDKDTHQPQLPTPPPHPLPDDPGVDLVIDPDEPDSTMDVACVPGGPSFPSCLVGIHHMTTTTDSLGPLPPAASQLPPPPPPPPPPTVSTMWMAVGVVLGLVLGGIAVAVWMLRHGRAPPKPKPPGRKPAKKAPPRREPPVVATPLITDAPDDTPPGTPEVLPDGHTRVGRLVVSRDVLGKGCRGTVVYVGYLDDRPVAVKRMMKLFYESATREVDLLIKSDGHTNVVRYFAQEEHGEYVYLALERCFGTLATTVSKCAKERAKLHRQSGGRRTGYPPVPPPTSTTRRFLRELVSGVAHLHKLKIVHRDIKPQNILLARQEGASRPKARPGVAKECHQLGVKWKAKISDMGLGKQLTKDASSFSAPSLPVDGAGVESSYGDSSALGVGTSGWKAPEVMALSIRQAHPQWDGDEEASAEDYRRTRAVDVWALGCILYYVLDAGEHPFGSNWYERDGKVLAGDYDVSRLDQLPDAKALVLSMIDANPAARPKARVVLEHPFFWDDATRLAFLTVVSDRLDAEPDDGPLSLVLEADAPRVVGHNWRRRLPGDLLADANTYRRYNWSSVKDLLRLLRNKKSHFFEMPLELRRDVLGGDSPEALVHLFTTKFPHLLMACYNLVVGYLAHEEDVFSQFLGPVTTRNARVEARKAHAALVEPAAVVAAAGAGASGDDWVDVAPVQRSWFLEGGEWGGAVAAVAERSLSALAAITVPDASGVGPPRPLAAAHATVRESRFRGGCHVADPRYKTSMCKDWVDSGGASCRRGARCDFAHGPVELRLGNRSS